jgi:hypothetical protein
MIKEKDLYHNARKDGEFHVKHAGMALLSYAGDLLLRGR